MATQHQRPLSPHLQTYRPQLTSFTSISHRATGIFLSVGTLALVYWLMAAANGKEAYQQAQHLLGSGPGLILLFAWSFSLFYHLCNGLRHLFWDAGYGFELKTAYLTGYLTLAGTFILTALAWALVFTMNGGM